MENMGEWERMNLINELTRGRELARQLQAHLNAPSSDDETNQLLVQKIDASYQKALSMVNCNVNTSFIMAQEAPEGTTRMSECGYLQSEDSDRCFGEPELKDASKKRNSSQPRWIQKVRVTPGMAVEGPLDYGFSWKKYGQKDILGSKYPRGYYRCTHRSVRGCLATKQEQRSGDDPTIFEITYIGVHTCTNVASNLNSPSGPSDGNQEQGSLHHIQKQSSQDLFLSFQNDVKVKTQDLDNIHHHRHQAWHSFPYTSSTSNVVFSSPFLAVNDAVQNHLQSNTVSPVASRTNFSFQARDDQTWVTDEYNIVQAAATSATSSPAVGLDFPFGNSQFDQNFKFDNNGFFP
ncbi:Detected protein of unknown function [Hibiscus syriacus]|uniref:WRKY domain-containing protein n=1 Tax=Hibiscus syriacus TaxID=106335 RepID=A0A6A3A643_HIBSY|nr:probable WRKY transcription factor 30 [Hibiscus syriacus]KAE8699820.1 Detected protein of unknown function [Hibiscus syriacus]